MENQRVTVFAAPVYSCEVYIHPSWKLKVRRFFRPFQELDRSLRPKKWNPQTKEFSTEDKEWTFVVNGDRGQTYTVKLKRPPSTPTTGSPML